MSAKRIRLADIAERLPAGCHHWLALMDAGNYESTETILNNVGAETFIKYWTVYKADLEKIQYDFETPWPLDVLERLTGKRQGGDMKFYPVTWRGTA
jgi:hypothetical protein